MHHWKSITLLAVLLSGGSSIHAGISDDPQPPKPSRTAAVGESLRTFMQAVAREVSQEGPTAWCRYFDTSPAFFMAVNGQLAFANGAAAKEGTTNFARTISHIELSWGTTCAWIPSLRSSPSSQLPGMKCSPITLAMRSPSPVTLPAWSNIKMVGNTDITPLGEAASGRNFRIAGDTALSRNSKPVFVHPHQEFTCDRKARGRADDRINLALWTECSLAIINPLGDAGRWEHGKAVEAATQRTTSGQRMD